MPAKTVSEEYKKLRVAFVEVLSNYVKEYAQTHTEEYVAEQTKQVQRVAKFLGVVK